MSQRTDNKLLRSVWSSRVLPLGEARLVAAAARGAARLSHSIVSESIAVSLGLCAHRAQKDLLGSTFWPYFCISVSFGNGSAASCAYPSFEWRQRCSAQSPLARDVSGALASAAWAEDFFLTRPLRMVLAGIFFR